MIKKILLIILLVLLICLIGYAIYNNISFVDENILNELASDSSSNTTQISKPDIIDNINIYLVNSSTKELEKESRAISLKELSDNPYLTLLNELKTKSENEKLLCPIPESTQILSASLENSTLVIDLSNDFISQDVSNELDRLILHCIVKTMTNLKEVSNIKINIEGNTSSKLGSFDLSSNLTNYSFES